MKILFLANPESAHTARWANSLAEQGFDIFIFGLSNYDKSIYKSKKITIYSIKLDNSLVYGSEGGIIKLKYLSVFPKLKKVIKQFSPDIIHAHYASSYGLLGAMCNFHPYIVSVWGSDVYSFPRKSLLHKMIFQFTLKNADKILATSNAMAQETKKYINRSIDITPFGIHLKLFKPEQVKSLFNKDDIVIGTIKTLDPIYGIEYLIKAFYIVKNKCPDLSLKLLIVGGGPQESILKEIVANLKIKDDTVFTGKVPYNDVPKYNNMLSVYVSVSNSESFGVSIIEASACEKPVIVSNVGGLPEVVDNGVTGIVVPPRNPEKTAEAIEKLILNNELRIQMGKSGRERVKKLYNWNDNVELMIKIYKGVIT